MALKQSIDLALASRFGASGLPTMALDAALSAVATALARLAEDDASGRLPLLKLPYATDDLPAIREAASFLVRLVPGMR